MTIMSYIDKILKNRGIEICPIPLWKLKFTDEEYEELRDLLQKQTWLEGRMPFHDVPRECTLFFAEYWRREYTEGSHSKEMVFSALKGARRVFRGHIDLCDKFYETAKRGAKMLHIEIYENYRHWALESMLYQGGLPMNLVVTPFEGFNTWDSFTTGLVFRNIDFDNLNLGIVASNSSSLRTYCAQLCNAVDSKQYKLLPFYCKDELNPWYQYLLNKFKTVRKHHRESHPFSLDWEFNVDSIDNSIVIQYILTGLQRIPKVFLEDHNLEEHAFFTATVRRNDNTVDSYDFFNGFSRYEVRSKHLYHNGDEITLLIQDEDVPHISVSLDLSTPHLLYRNSAGLYKLGNQLGKEKSLLIVPDGWKISDEESCAVVDYTWEDNKLKCIEIPEDFNGEIVTESSDGKLAFNSNAKLFWTEISSQPRQDLSNVIEATYNADEMNFTLAWDDMEGQRRNLRPNVEFRSKRSTQWENRPSYGEIYARIKDVDNNFVTPTKFINVGKDLKIFVVAADKEVCRIKVEWPYGKVFAAEGSKKIDGVWEFKKEECADKRRIAFDFTTTDDYNNSFVLHVKAPFKDFSIIDVDGKELEDGSWVPYDDIDKYIYHLAGMNIKQFSFGKQYRKLQWIDDKLYLFNGRDKAVIPYEGSLIKLLGGHESLRFMLEQTSKNMIGANITVEFILDEGKKLSFEIKDSPYRIWQDEDKITVTGKGKKPIPYTHALKLIKLDEPELEPITINGNENCEFIIPENAKSWERAIAIGRSRGRICPGLIDMRQNLSSEERFVNREKSIQSILAEINNSRMGDSTWQRIIGWFSRVQSDSIPASSLLDLYCVAMSGDDLIKLAFQLYCQSDDRDTLFEQLKSLSNDLAFQWFWLLPDTKGGMMQKLENFIGGDSDSLRNPVLQNLYITWAYNQQDRMKYILALSNDEYFDYVIPLLFTTVAEFIEWMKSLCKSSMYDEYVKKSHLIYDSTIENIMNDNGFSEMEIKSTSYVEVHQENLSEATVKFFKRYARNGLSTNEQWMSERVDAVFEHLKGNIDIFSPTGDFNDEEIRRSIIFCYKSTLEQFLKTLNNRLVHYRYEIR